MKPLIIITLPLAQVAEDMISLRNAATMLSR